MQRLKLILFLFLFTLLWLPLLQEQIKCFKESELRGAFIKPPLPGFSIDSLGDLKYQKALENYENYNFGFRGLTIKIRNSLNYLVFKDLNNEDDIVGKDRVIFSLGTIYRTLGIHYAGKEKNNATIERINFFKEKLEKKGVHLLSVIAPSKPSILPDYLPRAYLSKFKEQNDYVDFVDGYKKYGIPVIDFCSYFKKIKDTCSYPIFTKTGYHWSLYWAAFVQDSLVSYIENTLAKPLPKYKRVGVEISDTAREPDDDFEIPLNLFFTLGEGHYWYPKFEMIKSTKKNYRPKVIVIGDSFFWQIRNQKMLAEVLSEDSKFWYYFAKTSFSIGDSIAAEPLKNINIIDELESADFVILIGNIGTINNFPYGITDYYYDDFIRQESVKESIKNNPNLIKIINDKSKMNTFSADSLLTAEAKLIYKNRKSIQLKAANNKYISAGGEKEKVLIANRENAADWELFSLLQLEKNRVALYSYKNKFVSAELNLNKEITSDRTSIGAWEKFTIIELDGNYIAIKADNGKYLSLDEKSQQIFAKSQSIGKNEKFKLIYSK